MLGKVGLIRRSHVQGDQRGALVPAAMNAGTCAKPEVTVKMTPNSNTAAIAARKSAKIVVGGEMRDFLQKKVVAAGGDAAQVDVLRFGGKRKIGGVTVAVVPAVHSDGVDRKSPRLNSSH